MTKLSFSVTGEFITQHARNLVIEGSLEKAHETLMESLIGIDEGTVMSILRGDKCLTGTNDLLLEEDTSTEYRNTLNEMFGGCTVIEGRIMRPYGVVTTWGCQDYGDRPYPASGSDHLPCDKEWDADGYICDNIAGRSLHYARNPFQDVLKIDDEGRHVLFSEVKGFPHLIVKTVTWEESINHHLNGLRTLGHSVQYPEDEEVSLSPMDHPKKLCREKPMGQTISEPKTTFFAPRNTDFEEIRKQDIARWKEEIIEQANGDFIETTLAGREMKIPRAPFEQWALRGESSSDRAKPWNTVCPSGLKMNMDDPNHTDWMVGAGLPLNWMDDSQNSNAAYNLKFDLQEEFLSFKIPVLSGGGSVFGEIIHLKKGDRLPMGKVGIIRNAGPDYVQAAFDAIDNNSALITLVGGSLSHLASVGREKGLRLVRIEDALKKLPEGTVVQLDLDKGTYFVYDGWGNSTEGK